MTPPSVKFQSEIHDPYHHFNQVYTSAKAREQYKILLSSGFMGRQEYGQLLNKKGDKKQRLRDGLANGEIIWTDYILKKQNKKYKQQARNEKRIIVYQEKLKDQIQLTGIPD